MTVKTAKAPVEAPKKSDRVKMRVNKFGHGMISTGENDEYGKNFYYERGDVFDCSREAAERLEGLKIAEIVEEETE